MLQKKGLVGKRWLSFYLLAFFLFFYPFFQSPGLTGGDSGDLVTASALGGVSHPPGYPLYTFLGWLITRLPIGPNPAYRVGFLSSIPAAFSIFLGFLISEKIVKNRLLALIAALILAFNYLFWFQAEVQEVFALHLMFLFLTAYLVILWLEKPEKKRVYFLALITGLEFSHHHTYALILPALAYCLMIDQRGRSFSLGQFRKLFARKKGRRGAVKFFLTSLAFFLAGAIFYLYLPLASAGNPPINWGYLSDSGFQGLLRLISRADYGTFAIARGVSFSFRKGFLAVWSFGYFLCQEFSFFGVFLMGLGIYRFFKMNDVRSGQVKTKSSAENRFDKTLFYFSLIWFFLAGLFFQFYAGFLASNWFSLATMERFYLLVYPVFLIWISFGLAEINQLAEKLAEKNRFFSRKMKAGVPYLVASLLFIYPLFLLVVNLEKNDLRNFYEFDKFGQRLFDSCPEGSVLITTGDLEAFTSLYLHYGLGLRPDLKLISMDNPKRAVFYLGDFSQFRPYFKKNSSSPEPGFWLAFRSYLAKNDLTVCSTEGIKVSQDYFGLPRGLVYVYQKDLKEVDLEKIFNENIGLWQDYDLRNRSGFDPRFEAFYNRDLLRIYYYRALGISNFFFKAKDYSRARYWLEEAKKWEDFEESALRMEIIIEIKEGRCELAEQLIKERELILEEAETWRLIRAVYQRDCLGEEKNYEILLEELKTQGLID
jgi:hypothetical protein